MIDLRQFAIEKLKDYESAKQALDEIPQEIAQIESSMTSIRSARADVTPVKGGGSGNEDRIISLMSRKEDLERMRNNALVQVRIVDRALSILSEDEKLVLDRMLIHKEKGAAERLCDILGVLDPRAVYKRRDAALEQFTVALYGCTEI